MDLEHSIKDCCGRLGSIRATDRKKSAEQLKEFLSHTAVPSLLTKNTLKKKGYSWSNVFDDINDYVLKETEKIEPSKSFSTVVRPLFSSLLHLCVSGSNKGKAYIKCDKVIDMFLYIMKDARLKKAVGDIYLNLLNKHILSCEYYLSCIKPDAWEDLLNICLSECNSNDCELDDFTKLKLLWLITKNASSNCQFIIPLKNSLPKIKNYFVKVMDDKKVQDTIMEIMILLLITLSSECRLTMCEFTESLLSPIVKCYDQSWDPKKKASLFKLLYLTLQLHHPKGALRNEMSSLANDWYVWSKQIHNMLEIVCLESKAARKVNRLNNSSAKHLEEYYNMAAAVYYQVINTVTEIEDEDGSSSKRRRLSYNKNKTFCDLIEEFKQNHFPWLEIINKYIKNYGRTVSKDNYHKLITVINGLLLKNEKNLTWNALEEISCLCIKYLTLDCKILKNKEYKETLLAVWNSCARTSTLLNPGHRTVHSVMQCLLDLGFLQYVNVQPLLKLYYDRGMPVTNDSVITLLRIFCNFFSHCGHLEEREKIFGWLAQENIPLVGIEKNLLHELLLRLLSTENVNVQKCAEPICDWDILHNALFSSIETSILFSEFQLDILNKPSKKGDSHEVTPKELQVELNNKLNEYLKETLSVCIEKFKSCEVKLLESIKILKIALTYSEVILKYNFTSSTLIEDSQLHHFLTKGLRAMFLYSINDLKNKEIQDKVHILQSLEDLLATDYVPMLSLVVRGAIPENFFHCVNSLINIDISSEEVDSVYDENDIELNPAIVRQHCIRLLASYCTKRGAFREEVLGLILNSSLYNFAVPYDVESAFYCIECLSKEEVTDSTLVSIFQIMQKMCKDQFRITEISFRILKNLSRLLEKLWIYDDSMKQNCFIMIKGYLLRCETLHYPPYMAALIYECAVKMSFLNSKYPGVENNFLDIVMEKVKHNTYSIRLYCCYLLKHKFGQLSTKEIESYLESLMDLFVVKVSERRESILKDEISNRTLTLLHSTLAITQIKSSSLYLVVSEVIRIQQEKKLDEKLIQNILNKITKAIVKQTLNTFLNKNILFMLNYWFSKNKTVEDLPLLFFGFVNVDRFIQTHITCLVPAETLWGKEGLRNSYFIKYARGKLGKSAEEIIEASLSYILVLCLPYIVVEKYRINYLIPGNIEWSRNANNLFETARQILGAEKWSSLFADNLGELILLSASHLSDHVAVKKKFQMDIPFENKSYQYPTEVFNAILRYIGELTEGNIMHHLCENQPLAILKVLFCLWENFVNNNIYEYKVLSLYSFVTFLEYIPFGYSTDVFVYDFVCNSLAHAVDKSSCEQEIKILLEVLRELLERYRNEKQDIFGKSLFRILSVLMAKREKGYDECSSLINYLTEHSKGCLKSNEDVVDFVSTFSQTDIYRMCSTKDEFEEKLKSYNKNLTSPCLEALQNLRSFLRCNNVYVRALEQDLKVTSFSDDCVKSILHQVIHSLGKILKSGFDEKITIEACNSLIRIGNFDLKTFVTFPPSDTKKVSDLSPSQYFAIVVLKTLSCILFSEDPIVTQFTVNTLKDVLRYQEAKHALEAEDVDTEILSPFSAIESNSFAEFRINDEKFNSVCSSSAWILQEEDKYSDWITQVTLQILDVLSTTNNYLAALRDVCNVKVCQALLPSLMGLLIEASSEKHLKNISRILSKFFDNIWEKNFHVPHNSDESYIYGNSLNTINEEHKKIIQSVLEIVDTVRLQKKHYKMRPERALDALNYLKLEYDKVSWAAAIVGRHIDALYYAELWAVINNNGVPPESPDITSQLQGGDNVQRILRKCFTSIGETDALDGCGIAHLSNESEKRKHLIKSGQYSDALLVHDVALSSGGVGKCAALQHGVIKCLHRSGMHHLALQYIRSMPECDKFNDIKYDCLSFLGDWSEIVDTRELEEIPIRKMLKPNSVIKAYRYACLKDCLVQTGPNSDKLMKSLNKAKLAVAGLCQNLNMENCQNVYKVLSNLHLFGDVEDYNSVISNSNEASIYELINQWQVEKLPAFRDFKHLEPIISQRGLILEHATKTYRNLSKDIVSLQLQYVDFSLANKRIEIAQRLLSTVKKISNSDEVTLAESQISWAKGHRDIAMSLLRKVINNPADSNLAALSLRQYGVWMAESKSENTKETINKYLMQCLEILHENDYNESKLKVYHDIAKYAYAEYKKVVVYMDSKIFENKVRCVESMKDTVVTWKTTQQSLNNDERRALHASDQFGKIDEAEIANTRAEKEFFLDLAMRYYLRSLKYCEENNLSIFRVISLWLDNQNIELTQLDEETFEDLLHSIPSRKFITVLPQLGPRLTNENSEFAANLKKVIKRCAKDHPHHTLPIVFSLRNSDKDEVILNASSNIGGATPRPRSQEPRVIAAENLVNELATEDDAMAVIIAQMNKMCDATISFANYIPENKHSKQKIPAAETIHKLANLDAIPVPVDNIPISYDCDYSHIPTLYSFENYFELVGGINCPKKISCRCSDGRSKTLLIKGKDDLRQDAMMQQVFNIVNTLLEKDPVTSRNKLSIRTYKVVPMSRRSGMLEWCEGTMPIGSYLTGPDGAHARFRPQDISSCAARQKLKNLYDKRRSNQEKLTAFLKILTNFKPAFHYFFIENYLHPVTWYERRLAYTKSVATSSMVGYIMGLGDRHLQNILIDKRTAEVVHIDFGIAFDQGKILPTPETVPFRLTQDIISGFGSNGVEGIFRRSCEKTMQLLRDNQETLLTILEVLLCDPLYSWTVISNQQSVRVVSRDTTMLQSSSEGSLAKRALLTVGSKLSGTEGGLACGVAVPGQVARLINTATDSNNLSRLFHGWQPFL